jgi:hypothetical protein
MIRPVSFFHLRSHGDAADYSQPHKTFRRARALTGTVGRHPGAWIPP